MREICLHCSNVDENGCTEPDCEWRRWTKYPSHYKGKLFRSMKGMDRVMK